MLVPQSMALKRSNREKQQTLQELDEAWFHETYSVDHLKLFEQDWNLWKNIEDQKLENQKLQRKSALLACQTQQLNAKRDTLEVNLKELTEQLEALEEIFIEGDKEKLQEMKSLQQVAGDQNSLLGGIFEKMTLSKLKRWYWTFLNHHFSPEVRIWHWKDRTVDRVSKKGFGRSRKENCWDWKADAQRLWQRGYVERVYGFWMNNTEF